MTEKAPGNIKERIESLDNIQLSYQLAKILQNGNGLDSTLKKVIDTFVDLNDSHHEDLSEYEDTLIEVSMRRDKTLIPVDNALILESVNINNKKTVSLILLKKAFNHVLKNIDDNSGTWSEDHAKLKLIYDLYLSSTELTDQDVEQLRVSYKSEQLFAIADELLGKELVK